MPAPNQLHVRREDVQVGTADLLSLAGMAGAITEKVSWPQEMSVHLEG
jgi:hypothetical protein